MIQYKWLLYCISAPCRYVTFCPLCYQHRGLLLNCKKKIQTNVWLHIDFLYRLIYNPSTGTNKRSNSSYPTVLLLPFPCSNMDGRSFHLFQPVKKWYNQSNKRFAFSRSSGPEREENPMSVEELIKYLNQQLKLMDDSDYFFLNQLCSLVQIHNQEKQGHQSLLFSFILENTFSTSSFMTFCEFGLSCLYALMISRTIL